MKTSDDSGTEPDVAGADGGPDGAGPGEGPEGAGRELRFFLPTGEPDNTSAPTLKVDHEGGIHAVYPAYAGGRAYYAYCPSGCSGPDDVSVVLLPTEGTVANAMIALDSESRPQVLLQSFQHVYYAAPQGDFRDSQAWQVSMILDHHGDQEVTGEAFALDPQDRPRFLIHTYVAYLGVGQKTPETHYMTCDGGCLEPSNWSGRKIADQIWESNQLLFDGQGTAHVAMVAHVVEENASTTLTGAYAECAGSCSQESSWVGAGLVKAYINELEAVAISPTIALALDADGLPRVAVLADADFKKNLDYFECQGGCTDSSAWSGTILSDATELGAGVDLALDSTGHPRVVYTYDYNIGLAYCSGADCINSNWELVKVEAGGEMDPDTIFLYPNCNVGAWFLHSPSIALDSTDRPRVGYQARDISGGWSNPTPHETPDCIAGTDMTWSRMAILESL